MLFKLLLTDWPPLVKQEDKNACFNYNKLLQLVVNFHSIHSSFSFCSFKIFCKQVVSNRAGLCASPSFTHGSLKSR